MAIQLIINQAGPLPIKASFDAFSNEPMYLEVNGSVWSGLSDTMLGIGIDLDGKKIGTAQIFSGTSNTHRPVLPAYILIQLNQGQHTLHIYSIDTRLTLSDSNDSYTAVIHV